MSLSFKEYRGGQRILFSTESEYETAAAALRARGYTTTYFGKNWFPDREQYPFYVWIKSGSHGGKLGPEDVREIHRIGEQAARLSAPDSNDVDPVRFASDCSLRSELNRLEGRVESRLCSFSSSLLAAAREMEERLTIQLSALVGGDESMKQFISTQLDRSREHQLEGQVSRIEQERDQYWDLAQHEEEQRVGAESRIRELESELAGLNGTLQKINLAVERRTWSIPDRLLEMVREIAERWPDRVHFTESAFDSARNAKLNDGASNLREIRKVWNLLQSIPTVLWELVFDMQESDLDNQFKQRTGFELALTEGKQTKADCDCVEARTIEADGATYTCSAHLKYDGGGARSLRVHFAVDREASRIVVGHCGNHLETAGTRRLR